MRKTYYAPQHMIIDGESIEHGEEVGYVESANDRVSVHHVAAAIANGSLVTEKPEPVEDGGMKTSSPAANDDIPPVARSHPEFAKMQSKLTQQTTDQVLKAHGAKAPETPQDQPAHTPPPSILPDGTRKGATSGGPGPEAGIGQIQAPAPGPAIAKNPVDGLGTSQNRS